MPAKSSLKRQLKIYKLPEEVKVSGFRRMVKKDVSQVHVLVNEYLKKFAVHPELSIEEVKHMMLPRNNVVDCYVVEDDSKNVTDVVSFYFVPCSVFDHPTIKEFKVWAIVNL
jgi:glycylpeptide N-tetradecanoyltransferase